MNPWDSSDWFRPFESLGMAMETVGLWFLTLWCRIVGHKWDASVYPEPYSNRVESYFCERCWKVDYP